MPMPLEVEVTMENGSTTVYYIPLRVMWGQKPAEGDNWMPQSEWPWTNPTYDLKLDGVKTKQIASIIINPDNRMADVDRGNNAWKQDK